MVKKAAANLKSLKRGKREILGSGLFEFGATVGGGVEESWESRRSELDTSDTSSLIRSA